MKKFIVLAAVAALAACTTLNDKDRAMLEQASADASAAKIAAEKASATAMTAEQKAMESAEKCDRIFKKGLHK